MAMTTWRNTATALVLALLLAGCPKEPASTGAAPADAQAPAAESSTSADATTPADAPPIAGDDVDAVPADATAMERPGSALPPPPMPRGIAVGEPNPGAPGVVDASCKTDADCAIKDVGSCCGYHPACVNTASPTFPEQVKAQCAKSGRMGTCGFPAITGCKCTAGKCEGTGAQSQVQ